MMAPVLTIALVLMNSPVVSDRNFYFFGVATIDHDGTICLRIVSQEGNAPRAHGFLCYDKKHPQYREIYEQVMPIDVGQEKIIRPFK